MNEINRRNVLAFGEDGELKQELLSNSRVAVMGSSTLSQMVLSGLAGLGVGHIYFMDNERIKKNEKDFLCSHDIYSIGQKKVRHFEKKLEKINPTLRNQSSDLIGIHCKNSEAFLFSHRPEIIVDATNDSFSKEFALSYALNYRIPFISASSNSCSTRVTPYFPKNKDKILFSETPNLEKLLMRDFQNQKQEGFTSSIGAGIVCEEIRKMKFNYSEQDVCLKRNESFLYNLLSESRNSEVYEKISLPKLFRLKKVLMVGAGGIGNFVGLNLALLGIGRLDIVDMDIAEAHNLNRQILLYDGIGLNKSEVLSERLKEIDPHLKSDSITKRVGNVSLNSDSSWIKKLYEIDQKMLEGKNKQESFSSFKEYVDRYFKKNDPRYLSQEEINNGKYDLVLGCLDNKYARIWLNNFAIKNKIPYIDGGTGVQSGKIGVYIPGKTKCVDCQLGVSHFVAKSMSCADQPEGSVIMSNMIIGGAMVGEAIRVMYNLGKPCFSEVVYDINSEKRIGRKTNKSVNKKHNC